MPTLQQLQWFGAIVAILVATYPVVRWLTRPVLVQAWRFVAVPVRAHFAGINRMVASVERMEGEVTQIKRRVEAELGPNGGGSMKDQVTVIAARQAAIFDGMSRPAFQADASGRFVSVNRAFETLTGYPARDLLGKGWVNLIHQDQVEAFMLAWDHTIRDGRILRRDCVLVKASGDELMVCVDAVPVKAGARVLEWQGTFAAPEAA